MSARWGGIFSACNFLGGTCKSFFNEPSNQYTRSQTAPPTNCLYYLPSHLSNLLNVKNFTAHFGSPISNTCIKYCIYRVKEIKSEVKSNKHKTIKMNCVWRKYGDENVEKCKRCSFLPNLQYALSIKLFPWFIYIAINEVELKVLTI